MKAIKTERLISPGLHIVSLQRSFGLEYFITATSIPDEPSWKMFERAAEYVCAHNAAIISQDVFGLSDGHTGKQSRRTASGLEKNWPVTWIENRNSSNLSGTFIWAVSGTDVTAIHLHNRVVGNIVEDEFVRFIRLGDLTALKTKLTPQYEAWEVLEQMDAALRTAKVDFSDVIRTWFYNRDITAWYKDFNQARDEFFQKKNVFGRLVPASTAVGTNNGTDSAVIGGTLAVQGKSEEVKTIAVTSPLQGPALEYGSSFSRAVELILPDHRRLFISGTASIDSSGQTVHINDTPAQVKYTMEVMKAILKSTSMDFSNVTRSIGYFKHAEDGKLLDEYCRTNKLPQFPVIITENDICRDDLLFEIEVDAIK